MAYKFGLPGGETEFSDPSVKICLDNILHSSKNPTFVGWRYDTGTDVFVGHSHLFDKINVVEIFKPNTDLLSRLNIPKVVVYNQDIRDYCNTVKEEDCDCLVWQDGPEHLIMEEAKQILDKLKTKFKNIIIATPKGWYPQGSMYGNDAEEHLSSWEVEDYKNAGFNCSIIDTKFLIGYWKKD